MTYLGLGTRLDIVFGEWLRMKGLPYLLKGGGGGGRGGSNNYIHKRGGYGRRCAPPMTARERCKLPQCGLG